MNDEVKKIAEDALALVLRSADAQFNADWEEMFVTPIANDPQWSAAQQLIGVDRVRELFRLCHKAGYVTGANAGFQARGRATSAIIDAINKAKGE